MAEFVRRLAGLLVCCLALGTTLGPVHAASRNILVLIADDLGVDASAFYPVSIRLPSTPPPPSMPNLQRLADLGILFRSAWSNPLCVPSRAAIFTGRYGFRTGVGSNLAQSQFQALTLAEFITPEAFLARPNLGYRLAHTGKWHVSPGMADPNRFGWPYFAGGEPSRAEVPDFFDWLKFVNGVPAATTSYATTDSVNEAVAVIRRAKRAGKPYYVEVAFHAPHSPFHRPPNALHSRDGLPAYTPGAEARPYFEAMIEALDREIGRLLRAVDLASTTVVFVGDNGSTESTVAPPYDPDRSKSTMYENGIRVPLLLAGAGIVEPGRIVEGLVNTVDIFPTVLELAGIRLNAVVPAGRKIDGVRLVPYMRSSGIASLRQFIYAERFAGAFDRGYQRAVRNAEFKLIRRSNGTREFYNLRLDPLEMLDLLKGSLSPIEQANLSSLEARLAALLASR